MRALVREGGDKCGLTVVPSDTANSGPLGRAAPTTVAADQQSPGDQPSVSELHRDPAWKQRLFGYRRLPEHGDEGRGIDGVKERAAQVAVLEEMPHRPFLDLRMIEVEPEARGTFAGAAVADLDLEDR